MCCVPLTVPGGNPVTEVPGLNPRSPVIVVGPVLVTVLPARTPKPVAVPRAGCVAAMALSCVETKASPRMMSAPPSMLSHMELRSHAGTPCVLLLFALIVFR
jgi:hypothetical protein